MDGIGKLSPVEIRRLWPDEAKDFTPWLAENTDLLAEALGMDLRLEQTEAAVGRYSADLVFREEGEGRYVVVENMFAPTDHDHLGKLITYAAGLEACYAVLLAPDFRDEHRSALNWLNHISTDDFGFFGVVLEAWRIGDSLPAPRLRVDVQPDEWSRSVRTERNASLTKNELAYRRFWGEFLPAFKADYPDWTRTDKPSKGNWMSFPSAWRKLCRYNATFCKPDGRHRLRAEVYIDAEDAGTVNKAFDDLWGLKQQIEQAVGEELEWNPLDSRRASRISLYFPDDIQIADEDRWPEARAWLVQAMGKMRAAFDPVIKELQGL